MLCVLFSISPFEVSWHRSFVTCNPHGCWLYSQHFHLKGRLSCDSTGEIWFTVSLRLQKIKYTTCVLLFYTLFSSLGVIKLNEIYIHDTKKWFKKGKEWTNSQKEKTRSGHLDPWWVNLVPRAFPSKNGWGGKRHPFPAPPIFGGKSPGDEVDDGCPHKGYTVDGCREGGRGKKG